MKKSVQLSVISIFLLLSTSSCMYWTAPPYTSVDKITQIKPGMSIEQVNAVLNIKPYDVYNMQEDGSSIITYNYRYAHRRMSFAFIGKKKYEELTRNEISQTGGTLPWYEKSTIGVVYVLFNNMKVKSLITEVGLKNSTYILLENNTIQFISQEKIHTLHDTYLKAIGYNVEGKKMGRKEEERSNSAKPEKASSKVLKFLRGKKD